MKTFKEFTNEGLFTGILIGFSLIMFIRGLIKHKIKKEIEEETRRRELYFYNILDDTLDNFEETKKEVKDTRLYDLPDSYVIDLDVLRVKIFKGTKRLLVFLYGQEGEMYLTDEEYDNLEKKIKREYEKI